MATEIEIIQGPEDGTDAPNVQFTFRPAGGHESRWHKKDRVYYTIDGSDAIEVKNPPEGSDRLAHLTVDSDLDAHVNVNGIEPGNHVFQIWAVTDGEDGPDEEYTWKQV